MKHVKTVSRVNLSRAQDSATDIISTIVSILTAVGSLLQVLLPNLDDKQK